MDIQKSTSSEKQREASPQHTGLTPRCRRSEGEIPGSGPRSARLCLGIGAAVGLGNWVLRLPQSSVKPAIVRGLQALGVQAKRLGRPRTAL